MKVEARLRWETLRRGSLHLRRRLDMMKFAQKSVVFLLIGLLLNPRAIFAGSKTGADFLKIPVGARAVALGRATSALAFGVNSLNWNPAGLSSLINTPTHKQFGFSYSHQDLFFDTDLDHVGFGVPTSLMSNRINLGFSLLRMGLADQERRDANRQVTGSFASNDYALGLGLSSHFGSFQLGSHVKFLRQELADERAQGVALDFGFLSRTPIRKLNIGGTVRNLGPKMKFVEEEFDLPLTLSIGTSYQMGRSLTLMADMYSRPYQDEVSFALGTEIFAAGNLSLRAGYLSTLAETITNNQESESNRGNVGIEGLTAGLGIMVKSFSLDYALSQFGELGMTHSFTVGTTFGGEKSSSEPIFVEPPPAEEEESTIVIFENLQDPTSDGHNDR